MLYDVRALRAVPSLAGQRQPLSRSIVLTLAAVFTLLVSACGESTVTAPHGVTPSTDSIGTDAPPLPGLTSMANPLAGASFWVDPNSSARRQANLWRASRPADAAQMDKIASQPQGVWFGEWSGNIADAIDRTVTTVTRAGGVPLLVAYNIPNRDCGGFSGGGGATPSAYKTWISAFAKGIAGRKALVVLEPDALAGMDCLSASDQQTRLDLISYATRTLKAQGATAVYLDAGHPGWQSAAVMASRLVKANIAAADGFFENVSNFYYTSDNVAYGKSVSARTGGKHFIIDTSRNGRGPNASYDWCNPSGRSLGHAPTTQTGEPLVDAFLWIKPPGESDGACNGGPDAGVWWASYALGLAKRTTG